MLEKIMFYINEIDNELSWFLRGAMRTHIQKYLTKRSFIENGMGKRMLVVNVTIFFIELDHFHSWKKDIIEYGRKTKKMDWKSATARRVTRFYPSSRTRHFLCVYPFQMNCLATLKWLGSVCTYFVILIRKIQNGMSKEWL